MALAKADDADPEWYPLQHLFRLTAFGANAFLARAAGTVLVEEHDEAASGQEEVYLVIAGEAEFSLDGECVQAPAVTAIAVRDPSVRCSAEAKRPETLMLAFGAPARDGFDSTWDPGALRGRAAGLAAATRARTPTARWDGGGSASP